MNWDEVEQQMKLTHDALGKSIDAGIMDTVIALNVLGVETTASCEGHRARGYPYPWIAVAVKSVPTAFRLLQEFYQELATTTINYDTMLILRYGTETRLQSNGAIFTEPNIIKFYELPEPSPQRIEMYKQEMQAFTEFLIRRIHTSRCSLT